MILIDTSAWVEFLRNTQSPVCERVSELLASDIATTDAVRMELLAGARNERHLGDLRRLLARASHLSTAAVDYEAAAQLYRQCRSGGETVRRIVDCLIGAVAVRTCVAILHYDADFEVLARHTAVATVSI